jgi:pyruvate formate lyase activating enzyme
VPNDLILDNVRKIRRELSIPILARLPLIPGYNDSLENIEATARFVVTELGDSTRVHLLPYHRLGEAKYERLEMPDKAVSIEPPSDERMSELQKTVESFGLTCVVGG